MSATSRVIVTQPLTRTASRVMLALEWKRGFETDWPLSPPGGSDRGLFTRVSLHRCRAFNR